jgi:hypothetical protein
MPSAVSKTLSVPAGSVYIRRASVDDIPFATIAAAIAVSQSGDVIFIGRGTFAQGVAANTITLPAGVSLVGSGIDVSIITGAGALANVLLVPGTGSIIDNLTVQATGNSSAPIGCGASDTAFTSAIIRSCKFIGTSDSVYLNNASATGLQMFDCIIQSTFDTIFCGAAGTHDFFNCDVSTDGSSGLTARGIVASAGTIRFYGGKISTTKTGTNITASASGGTIELHNTRTVRNSGGSSFDLQQTSGTLAINNVVRGDGAALTTSGTITNLQNIVDAQAGFTIAGASASGKFPIGDGTKFATSGYTLPSTSGTNGTVWTSDGSNISAALPPIILVFVKSVTILTSGTPADLATLTVPAALTRYRVAGTTAATTQTGFMVTETQVGTPTAGTCAVFTAAGGGGTQVVATTAPSAGAGSGAPWPAFTNTGIFTSSSLVIRQMANSLNSATVSFYVYLQAIPS